jgi:TetR/AcrR family fatty acid metabolism transcriptional regulator
MVRLTEAARDLRVEERRSQILRAALLVFGQKGFHGATIREIASAAGLAEGTIYLYFTGKQEVLRGVFTLIADEASAPPAQGFEAGDDEAFLRSLLESRITSLSRHAAFLRLSVHEADLHESLRREFFAKLCEPFVAHFEGYLRRRIADGAFRPVNAALTAATCFRMLMSHIMVQHVLEVDPSAARHAGSDRVSTMVSLILYGITARRDAAESHGAPDTKEV